MTIPDKPTVLIAGAGPTGLVLALVLARLGTPFRIVDSKSGPVEQSRALGVQARTLEFYQRLGIADDIVTLGVPGKELHLLSGGKEVTSLTLTDMGAGVSPYPFLLCLAQDLHERFLVDHLAHLGVEVEWETALDGFEQDAEKVTAALRRTDGAVETVEADWIVGCDGAHSVVRKSLDLAFEGGKNEGLFYVADVAIDGEAGRVDGDIHISLNEDAVALLFPVRSTGAKRIIGLVPSELASSGDVTWDHVKHIPASALGVAPTDLHWFSTFRVSHRVAASFRGGRAFLAGDAGHIHSPLGGQGMNTGIGDAINLGWKLAAVSAGAAEADILETYEDERIRFARKLIHTTDRAFGPLASESTFSKFLRGYIAPHVAQIALHLPHVPQQIFKTVSQTRINYRESALSTGNSGDVVAGDRLPWVPDINNFDRLGHMSWHAHVYGMANDALEAWCRAAGLDLEVLPFSSDAAAAGLRENAAYLLRPDGYIGCVSPNGTADDLTAYMVRHGLRFSWAQQQVSTGADGQTA